MSPAARRGGLFEGDHTRARGASAERDGARYLEAHGYRVVERNVSFRVGEIDLVAVEGDTLCFVEIKARRTNRFGSPGEAVTVRKQRRLTRCARLYLARRPYDGPCRFDVLALPDPVLHAQLPRGRRRGAYQAIACVLPPPRCS